MNTTHTYKTMYISHTLIFSFLLLFAISTKVYAQKDPSSLLVGQWSFDESTSFSTIEANMKARMDTIPQLQSQLLSIYRGRQTSFASDGSYNVTLADGRSSSGTWQLDSDDHILLIDPNGNKAYYRINSLDNSRLVLIPITSSNSKSIVEQWHFTKL